MRTLSLFCLALLAASPARGHFLFIRVQPAAEAGRAVEVYFSEYADAGDPRFIDKVAGTSLWLQTKPGEFSTLEVHKLHDRLRAFVPVSGPLAVIGRCDYGVLPRQTPFLLRHFPKAVAGEAEAVNRLLPRREIPFEIQATFLADRVELVALANGKPVPHASFETVDSNLQGETIKADARGKAVFKPLFPDVYCVYTGRTLREAGEYRGKKYLEIREFTTLSFRWPSSTKGADAEAVKLFEQALEARASWKDFPGFTAEAQGRRDGRAFHARVAVDARGNVEVKSKEEAAGHWLREQLESITLHRAARARDSRQKPVLRFGDDDERHPLGRLLIFEGGQFASSYRVKDRQLTVVNRALGKQHMTITVIDNDRNAEGLYLPRSYLVQYWDASSGRLQRTETVTQRWVRVGKWDLPAEQTVTTASEKGLTVWTFSLSKHSLLNQPSSR